jgi:hypothetical protein
MTAKKSAKPAEVSGTGTRLPAGPLKYLLTDEEAISRNLERSPGNTQSVAVVIVVAEDGTTESHRATSVEVLGKVSLAYSQHALLLPYSNRRPSIRAAYTTTAEVVLD